MSLPPVNNQQRIQQTMLRILEAKYQKRGLHFEPGGWGYFPVQIYGEIDGNRFYWRTGGNTSTLSVGPYNKKLEEAIFQAHEKFRLQRLNQHKAEQHPECKQGTCFTCLMLTSPDYFLENDEQYYYPTQVIAFATVHPVGDPEDHYKGHLELDEVAPLFTKLVESLEEVPLEYQIPISTLDMLEGKDLPIFERVEVFSDKKEEQDAYIEAERKRLTQKWAHLFVN